MKGHDHSGLAISLTSEKRFCLLVLSYHVSRSGGQWRCYIPFPWLFRHFQIRVINGAGDCGETVPGTI